jgi:hypothetical protein
MGQHGLLKRRRSLLVVLRRPASAPQKESVLQARAAGMGEQPTHPGRASGWEEHATVAAPESPCRRKYKSIRHVQARHKQQQQQQQQQQRQQHQQQHQQQLPPQEQVQMLRG